MPYNFSKEHFIKYSKLNSPEFGGDARDTDLAECGAAGLEFAIHPDRLPEEAPAGWKG